MRQPTILIVEDDPTLLDFLHEALTSEGYIVATAADGLQAVTAARELSPSLILLDVHMPKMDGHTFMQYVRARGLAIPVLLLSGSNQLDALARELGVRAYLKKPFNLDELLSSVEALLPR